MTRRAALGTAALAVVPVAVLAVFFLYPVAGMLGRGFWSDGRFRPGDVLAVLGRSRTEHVLWFTLWTSTVATALAVLGGVPAAFALHRLRLPGRRLLSAVVVLPFVLPTVVVGIAFRRLIAAGGPLGGLGLDGTPAAIIAALVFFNIGVVVRTVGALWEGLDHRAEEAASALGAPPWRVFTTVTWPALRPAVVSAASVVFLFCATAFGVVLTMGGLKYANVETEIYLLTTQELDLRSAAALSVLQLLVIVALLVVSDRARRAVVRGAAPAGRRRVRTRDAALVVWTLLVAGFVLLPVGTLVVASLHTPTGWGFGYYRALQTTGSQNALLVPASDALAHSLRVAVIAASFALLLGGLVAFLVSRPAHGRTGRRVRALFDGAFMLPLGVSAVTLGFGFLITLNHAPLDLRSSPLLVPIAQAMVALPLVVRTVVPALRAIDPRQREAAASLGAGPLRVVLAVDVPAAWRALLASAGFAFAVSLGEFGATSFLSRDDDPTLPVVIYDLIGHPGAMNFGMAMAGAVLLAATTAAVMALVEQLRVGSVGAF
jgi:thiamine transport system permease protein